MPDAEIYIQRGTGKAAKAVASSANGRGFNANSTGGQIATSAIVRFKIRKR